MPRRSEEDLCLTAPPPLPGHVSSTIVKPKASLFFFFFFFRTSTHIYIYTHTQVYSPPINTSFFLLYRCVYVSRSRNDFSSSSDLNTVSISILKSSSIYLSIVSKYWEPVVLFLKASRLLKKKISKHRATCL